MRLKTRGPTAIQNGPPCSDTPRLIESVRLCVPACPRAHVQDKDKMAFDMTAMMARGGIQVNLSFSLFAFRFSLSVSSFLFRFFSFLSRFSLFSLSLFLSFSLSLFLSCHPLHLSVCLSFSLAVPFIFPFILFALSRFLSCSAPHPPFLPSLVLSPHL